MQRTVSLKRCSLAIALAAAVLPGGRQYPVAQTKSINDRAERAAG